MGSIVQCTMHNAHTFYILIVLNEINYNTIRTMLSFTHLNPPHLIYYVLIQYVSTMNEKNTFFGDFTIHFIQNFIRVRELLHNIYETIHTLCTVFFSFFISVLYFVIARMKHEYCFLLQYHVSNRFRYCFCTDIYIYMGMIFIFCNRY